MRRAITTVALVLVAASCSGSTARTTTVTSDDGALTLTLPAGTDIAVSIGPADLPVLGDETRAVAAFDLGPDGATFADPVDMVWRTGIAADPAAPPLVGMLIDHGAGFESADNVAAVVEDGEVVLRGTIDGFSTVVAVSEYNGLTVSLTPAAFTAVLDAGQLVTATLGGDCAYCVVDLPQVSPDVPDRDGVLDTAIEAAGADATAWTVTCLRTGTAHYTGSVSYRIQSRVDGLVWGGTITAVGTATCIHEGEATTTTTVPFRIMIGGDCTDASVICPPIDVDLSDPETITIGFPDLGVKPSLTTIRLKADYSDITVECRSFGDISNCGTVNDDQTLRDTFDIELGTGDVFELRLPRMMLQHSFGEGVSYTPVSAYVGTEQGAGEMFFGEADQQAFRDALLAGG